MRQFKDFETWISVLLIRFIHLTLTLWKKNCEVFLVWCNESEPHTRWSELETEMFTRDSWWDTSPQNDTWSFVRWVRGHLLAEPEVKRTIRELCYDVNTHEPWMIYTHPNIFKDKIFLSCSRSEWSYQSSGQGHGEIKHTVWCEVVEVQGFNIIK